MVYQTVVTPVLAEVMRGYNCTVFAYGQTGTGKTHTMEGDLTSQVGTYSPEAGIIPRTLYRLFHQLELSGSEYSVHASFVELYNEELRDLLSTDAPKPLSTGGLKVYDDKGKGVIIQGLEDTPMRDAAHGLSLLRRGSQKRQIASTRCNESSSRSHSIFTMTVHTKETTVKGEDVLRVGKLNLVDLAGSENIGRSGAENKRAREAGMINQSLLTLGRVINALVEKNSHVPYRESKLTRLLQESLGGRTKTCIIATVSPDRDNLEETLSTLDYALRAKSIRNRPEMNSRMTRAGLITEYVREIERLKRDILAARGKEGFYVSSESWREVQDESEARRTAADELRRLVEVAESKRESLQEQFEQNMQMLIKRETEAKSIKAECAEKTKELDAILEQARNLEGALTEEMELREAYRNSERKLNRIASDLRARAEEGQNDLGGLFAKLERKSRVEETNQRVVSEFQKTMAALLGRLRGELSEFTSGNEGFSQGLMARLQSFRQRETSVLETFQKEASNRFASVQRMTQKLFEKRETGHANVQGFANAVDVLRKELEMALEEQTSLLREEWSATEVQLNESQTSAVTQLRRHFNSMNEVVGAIIKQAQAHVMAEQDKFVELRSFAQQASSKEIAEIRQQNEKLATMLLQERSRSSSMREKLADSILGLIDGYAEERDRSLTDAFSMVQSQLNASGEGLEKYLHSHKERIDGLARSSTAHGQFLVEREGAVKKIRKRSEIAFDTSTVTVEKDLTAWRQLLDESFQAAQQSTEEMAEKVQAASIEAQELSESSYAAQRAELEGLMEETQRSHAKISSQVSSTSAIIEGLASETLEGVARQRQKEIAFAQSAESQMSRMENETHMYLEDYFAQDVPTGETPQRKDPVSLSAAHWKLVPGTRQKALEQHRHLVAKKQASSGVPRHSEAHSVGTLPDDTRASIRIVKPHETDGSDVDLNSTAERVSEDEGEDKDGDGDENGEWDEDEELEDSLQDVRIDSDDTVKVSAGHSELSAGALRSRRVVGIAPAPIAGVTVGAARSKVASRSASSAGAGGQQRSVLAEKNVDPNIEELTLESGAQNLRKPVGIVGANVLRRPGPRRLTKV